MSRGSYGDVPICVAVVICSEVIEDKRSNNKSLINVFNTITTNQLPVIQGRFAVLVSITNALGAHELLVMLRDPNGESVLSVPLPLASTDPLETHDLVLELISVALNLPGMYSIDVSCGSRHVGSRRFLVDYRPT